MRRASIGWAAAGIIGGAVVTLAALSGVQYRRDVSLARERINSLGSQVIDTACGPIEYATTGSGYPVLAVHGNGGGFDQGLGLAAGYLEEGFQVIAPSRFGYLRTPLPAGATPALQADAYACLLDALGIEQAALFTSSAGVTSAVQFAVRHPDRLSAMVLHSPNAPGEVEMALPPRPVLRTVFHSDPIWWTMSTYLRPVVQALVGVPQGFALTEAQAGDVKKTLAEVLPISARGDGMMFDTFVSNPDINTGYPFEQVAAPTLVVSAVDDPMALHANARTLAQAIPGARLVAVADGGHMMLGHGDEVKAEITGFLRQATAVAAQRD